MYFLFVLLLNNFQIQSKDSEHTETFQTKTKNCNPNFIWIFYYTLESLHLQEKKVSGKTGNFPDTMELLSNVNATEETDHLISYLMNE